MLLIATALAEELETALNLCSRVTKTRIAGIPVWTGVSGKTEIHMVKLGMGPRRSASTLGRAIAALNPERALIAGYAGALDPGLKIGDLIAVKEARLFLEETWGAPLGELGFGAPQLLAGTDQLVATGRSAGVEMHSGTALTMPCVVGAPEHKRMLFERFRAAIVDMETAALAAVADRAGVPLHCVRAISDEADDDFLASFSYHPGLHPLQRAAKTVAAGRWLRRYSDWRERSRSARHNLTRFLASYLEIDT